MTVAFNGTLTLATLHAVAAGPAPGAEITKTIDGVDYPFVGEVYDMDLPDQEETQIDITAFGDTERDYIDFKLPPQSSLGVTMAFHPGFDITDYVGTVYYLVLEFPFLQTTPTNGNVMWYIRVRVEEYEPQAPMEDKAVVDLSMTTLSRVEVVNS